MAAEGAALGSSPAGPPLLVDLEQEVSLPRASVSSVPKQRDFVPLSQVMQVNWGEAPKGPAEGLEGSEADHPAAGCREEEEGGGPGPPAAQQGQVFLA